MRPKHFFVIILTLVGVVMLGGCGILGGGEDANAKPTPTLPFPTNIAVATTAPGSTTAAPQEAGSIGGDVFNDSDGNGAQDAGEQTIAGVTVQIGSGNCPGTPMGQMTSAATTPTYKFTGLNAGTYCVSINADLPQNAAILGPGEWTFPQKAQGVIASQVNLNQEPNVNASFGWTFATLEGETPGAEQPTAEPVQPTAAPILPTPTAFVQPTAAPAACVFKANYIADVTIPDGTVIAPGAQFVKTWRLLNTGTCSWGPGTGLQNLQFASGDALGAPNLVPIPNTIPAGTTGDLSINMVAPTQGGSYKSNWKLRADNGDLIGVGPSNVALFASIRVQAAPAPTKIPGPTSVPPSPPAQAIQFAPGATEAEAQGQLQASGIAAYSLAAQQGQIMQLTLSSNSSTARIAVRSPNGVPLAPQRGNPEGTYWQGTLPATGTYALQVLAGNGAPAANYSLNVTIPVRISFAPGGISASEKGVTNNSRVVTYLLKASGGQTMTLNLLAPPDSAGITLYGLDDGQPLIRSQSGATSFNGPLPATQDYVIQVVPFVNTQVNYTLEVKVQ